MMIDEKLRWYGFWLLDSLHGGKEKAYYNKIKESYQKGTSIAETQVKLGKLIAHAVKTTDFYKDFPADASLEMLPVMNKDTYRNRYDAFLSKAYKDAPDNRIMSTSGSTGTPFQVVQDHEKILWNQAGGVFLGALGGWYIGMKDAFVRMWVGDHGKKSRLEKLKENLVMVNWCNIDDKAIGEMLEQFRRKKVKCIIGYASAIADISRYIDQYQVDLSGFCVKSIIPISESMPVTVRRRLEEQFHCSCRSWYSNEENGIMGIQNAEDESYYIDTERYYYEILKMDSDEPAEPGELGRIVITDLYNYAMPLIRYDNGDTAVAGRQEKNGRYRLYLKELYGRRYDMVYDCQGRAVSPFVLYNNLTMEKGLKQYRFIQEDVTKYTLWLNGDREEMDVDHIVGLISPYFGKEAEIEVCFVDEIPTLNSGKRKYIENRCEKYKGR